MQANMMLTKSLLSHLTCNLVAASLCLWRPTLNGWYRKRAKKRKIGEAWLELHLIALRTNRAWSVSFICKLENFWMLEMILWIDYLMLWLGWMDELDRLTCWWCNARWGQGLVFLKPSLIVRGYYSVSYCSTRFLSYFRSWLYFSFTFGFQR